MSDPSTPAPIGWAILELMGHRKLAGYLTEQEVAGKGFIRLDVFAGGPPADADQEDVAAATQLYSPGAVYCITPTTEEIARALGKEHVPAPVQRWELPAPPRSERYEDDEELDDVELAR